MAKTQNNHALVVAFGLWLGDERKKRKMSQKQLAKKSKISRQCISFFEIGLRSPTFFSMIKLAEGLDISLSQLFLSLAGAVRRGEYANEAQAR